MKGIEEGKGMGLGLSLRSSFDLKRNNSRKDYSFLFIFKKGDFRSFLKDGITEDLLN